MRDISSRRRPEKFDGGDIGSARSMGEGRRDALHGSSSSRVVKTAPEPGGVVTLVRCSSTRATPEAGEERDRHLPRRVPERIVWGNTNEGKGYDLVLLGPESADPDRRRLRSRPSCSGRIRADGPVAARDRHALGSGSVSRPTPAASRSRAVLRTRRSIATATCACSIWRAWADLYQADVIYADLLRTSRRCRTILFIASETTRKRALFAAITSAQGR